MAHIRRTPHALIDPKLSVVIPVYNEKETIFEILRRVLDTEIRKEIVVVDDCSKDGTREILENIANRQANGEPEAPATDGGDPVALKDIRFFFQEQNQGKGAALRRALACSASFRWASMSYSSLSKRLSPRCKPMFSRSSLASI